MKPFRSILALTLLSSGILFSGCTIRYYTTPNTLAPTPTPVPFPYALQVEARVQEQLNRIAGYLSGGSLTREQSDVLTDNALLVRRLAAEFRAPSRQKRDLTPQQATLLNNMLDDNARFIDDALKRRQYWAQYLLGGSYNYTTVSNRYVYISYLDFQTKRQFSDVESGLKSRKLSSARARELRARIKSVADLKLAYYRANGRMDLSEEQVRQISQMAEDNSNYIAFCMKKGKGRWNKEKFNGWKKRTPKGLEPGQMGNWGNSDLPKVIPTSTPLPPLPTYTPVPAPKPLTATPTFVPTSTPVPVFTATPVPTSASAPVFTATPVPTSTPKPVVEEQSFRDDKHQDDGVKKGNDGKEGDAGRSDDKGREKEEDKSLKDEKKEHDDQRESGEGKKLGHEKQRDREENGDVKNDGSGDKKDDEKGRDKDEDKSWKDRKKEHDDARESGHGKKLGHEKQKDRDENEGVKKDDEDKKKDGDKGDEVKKEDDDKKGDPKKDDSDGSDKGKKSDKAKGKKKGHEKGRDD